ncbi:MAG: leucine-rich repeat protein [Bacteroidales bacterium]|nr:leucine-rich repeat protein [Bacteroidales bacterium]
MRAFKTLTLAALSAVMLFSCTKDDSNVPKPQDEDLIPLNISGAVNQVHTKVTSEGFVNNDAVGLFAVNYESNNTVAGTLHNSGNQADNVRYNFDESNHKWVPVRPVYYKNINTNVDLYLYYPFQSSITDVNNANFEVQKDQSTAATSTALSGYEASDWMWGKATNITPQESSVQIMMNHCLSAVQVTLNEGTGFSEGEFESISKSVILTNTTRKATLDYSTGTPTALGSPQKDGIVMCPQTDGSFRAIVIPQTVTAGTQLFAITLDGVTYSFKKSDADISYQKGKQLSFSINLNKKTPTGTYELQLADAQISDWREDLNSHGGEARQYFVVNLSEAGTLESALAAANKNPDKIRNLKITGKVNANDYYYMRDHMAILEAVNMKETEYQGETPEIPEAAFQSKTTLTNFVFPDNVQIIGMDAFERSKLSGALIIPSNVISIGDRAFNNTLITSVQFSSVLKTIGNTAFGGCSSLSGSLLLPESLVIISESAFSGCRFTGRLELPSNLEEIGRGAFGSSGTYTGGLRIPDKIRIIRAGAFQYAHFSGPLDLNNVTTFEEEFMSGAFWEGNFIGDLIIPEGVVSIPGWFFSNNRFNSVHFPSTLRVIKESAFTNNSISEPLVFNEGLLSIEQNAFSGCGSLTSLEFPSTLQSLGNSVFEGCSNISSITSKAIEPPTVQNATFNSVAKNNFTVEVPASSIKRYQAENGWSDFKRIGAYYDFSLSRSLIRALDGEFSKTYVLRVPSGMAWSIDEKPDWVTVSPAFGTGRTDVTITIAEMQASEVSTFEVNEGTVNRPSYKNYSGRSGVVVFKLDDKDYTYSVDVEQYHSNYPDGMVETLQTATSGPGIDIVFVGDGYDAKDIAKGIFHDNAVAGYGHLFDVEPYKTYKNYFNVYAVTAMSDETGIGTVNTIVDTKFGSTFTQNRILLEKQDEVFQWSKKANASMDLTKSLVVLLQNTNTYEGVTYMYGDGSSIACCPVSTEAYPYDFRGIVQHEAGGHGFGKLGDEYIYANAFIQNCGGPHDHPKSDNDTKSSFGAFKALGWYKNLSMTADAHQVPWAHLIYNNKYSDYVDMFEGGYMHTRGMYRSEATSCMNNNIPYFSAISRQAIVERIKEYAGEEFTLESFYALDKDDFGPTSKAASRSGVPGWSFGVDPKFNRATGHGPIYMGKHPNVR